jgi:hypothetical protein
MDYEIPIALLPKKGEPGLIRKHKELIIEKLIEEQKGDKMILGREAKAERIVERGGVRKTIAERVEYKVEGDRGIEYIVTHYVQQNRFTCTCPDHIYRERECKHIKAVKKDIQEECKVVRYGTIIFEVEAGANYKRVMGLLQGMEENGIIRNLRGY